MTVDVVTTRTSKKKARKPEADAQQQRLAAEMIEQAREQGLALGASGQPRRALTCPAS